MITDLKSYCKVCLGWATGTCWCDDQRARQEKVDSFDFVLYCRAYFAFSHLIHTLLKYLNIEYRYIYHTISDRINHQVRVLYVLFVLYASHTLSPGSLPTLPVHRKEATL